MTGRTTGLSIKFMIRLQFLCIYESWTIISNNISYIARIASWIKFKNIYFMEHWNSSKHRLYHFVPFI